MSLGFSKCQGLCSWHEFTAKLSSPGSSFKAPKSLQNKDDSRGLFLLFLLKRTPGKTEPCLLHLTSCHEAHGQSTEYTNSAYTIHQEILTVPMVGCLSPCPARHGSLQNVSASCQLSSTYSLCINSLLSNPWEFWSRINEGFSKLLVYFSSWIETSGNWCIWQLIPGHWGFCLQGKMRNGPGVIRRHPGPGLHR